MTEWYIILAASGILLPWLVRMEWKRRNRARLALRIALLLAGLVSLLALAFPTTVEEHHPPGGKIIILTNGFLPDSFENSRDNNKDLPLFSPDLSLVQQFSHRNVQYIPDLASFLEKHKEDSIHVFGYGFSNDQLATLGNRSFIFHDAPGFPATDFVYWKPLLKTGERIEVQGRYMNLSPQEVKIFLQAFGETLDSTLIPASSNTGFSVSGIPLHTGKAVYSLLAVSGTDTLQNEPLPLNVESTPRLKILMLSSSPDFEKTFLKNRLAQNRYELTVNTSVSQGRKDIRFLNGSQTNANPVQSSYLEKFDVLIADDESLAQLQTNELAAVRSAIGENGMGMVVKISSEKNTSSFYSKNFPAYALKQDKKSFSRLYRSVHDSDRFTLKIEEPLCLRRQDNTQVLLQDQQSNIYAANTIYGQGRIVATTLNNTYTMALAGNNRSWQSLWSLLLDKAARKIATGESWSATPSLTHINDPSTITYEGKTDPPGPGLIEASKIYLQQPTALPFQWQGIYWPVTKGWQSLIRFDGRVQYWYAYDTGDWKKMADLRKLNATKKYSAAHPVLFVQQPAGHAEEWTSYIKFFGVILFLVCCTALWVEQKLA